MALDPASLPDDVDALKRMIVGMARDAVHASTLIEKLRSQLARLKRAQFGRSSEKLRGQVEQLELAIEALETDEAERLAAAPAVAEAVERARPARRPLPEHLTRESVVHAGPCACPSCGGALRRIGEDVTETLDYVPGRFKVVRHVREAFSCRACETVVQAPAPHHAIARGRAGPGLLARIAVAKFDDHLPLYRQAEIFAREGVELATSTLSGWVGATAAALMPLVDQLRGEVLAGSVVLHGDDTPVPVLAPGTGKTRTGRLWAYVRDERPWEGANAPAAVFFASPDRRGERPLAHLAPFSGTLQADGYSGFNALYEHRRSGGALIEAACWAHTRRYFFDVHAKTGSGIAREALERIGALYEVERSIRGRPPDARRRERGLRSRPLADALRAWAGTILPQLSASSDLAKAFRYMLARWAALTRVFDDGRLALDNNAAERALRGVAVGRKNYLFAGSERGAERAAALYSLIETAKLNGLDPEAYLRDVLTRIADHPARRLPELLPWNWTPIVPAAQAA
ncbi:IS66 family transposase [Methylobacterium iners]|uniref:IS66 family transposase ISAzs21 n=1 Tax=Methylobacterium iners TaxID=418707 RepID=A0ABQ4S4J8_9HYPH|nr:IS66 family transposase [Methylobacterium iners]GJD98004.1 IS66 family transposase ISAzs21 [Methylobacterium iners]